MNFLGFSKFFEVLEVFPRRPKDAPDASKKLEDLPKTPQDASRRPQDGPGFPPGRDERSERASAASDASEAIRLFHVCFKLSESLPKRFLALQIQYLINAGSERSERASAASEASAAIRLFQVFQNCPTFQVLEVFPRRPKDAPDASKKLEDLPKTPQDASRRPQDGPGFPPGRDERSERASAASDASEAIRLFHVCFKLSESLPKRFLALQIQYLINAGSERSERASAASEASAAIRLFQVFQNCPTFP